MIEYIEWLDHCSIDGGEWKDLQDVENLSPSPIKSVGWVIKETESHITLISHWGDHEVDGEMLIIKSCIVKRIKLKEDCLVSSGENS